ncbi:hypothetical protein TNCV_4414211 [Trichonephila clavipes]|uniref:Uncharacterized protein n=1 Tax=Trichonephila clavipes TaxID=2585209 RepID=A0A8X6S3X1_TRICX|nr:hypothetical protein TNCV_4414211 [Trichonephila clavipes]
MAKLNGRDYGFKRIVSNPAEHLARRTSFYESRCEQISALCIGDTVSSFIEKKLALFSGVFSKGKRAGVDSKVPPTAFINGTEGIGQDLQ